MHTVIFRRNGELNIQTQYFGPFASWDDAYEFLCELPAVGIAHAGEEPGVKYIVELQAPDLLKPKTVEPTYFNGPIAFSELLDGGNVRTIGVRLEDGGIVEMYGVTVTAVTGKPADGEMFYEFAQQAKLIVEEVREAQNVR